MADSVSIFDVIKRGGYEASLITTFNANLAFYEEVVLRKLVGAGCRHNVVLIDREQCAVACESEGTRPRAAGCAYTLLPIAVPGAFHPKVCLLLGPKKASILVGSHNLTISGFGYNREVSNWIEIGGAKDTDGAAALRSTWHLMSHWISVAKSNVPKEVFESALAINNFVTPLLAPAVSEAFPSVIGQWPGERALIEQLAARMTRRVKRIGVIGAFFDKDFAFLKELHRRWPEADVVVGIQPDTVEMPGSARLANTQFVELNGLWQDSHGYMHAKLIFLDTGNAESDVLASGSANPSRPAWMATATDGNIEAMLVRVGHDARAAMKELGLDTMFDLPAIEQKVLNSIARRCGESEPLAESASMALFTGVADYEAGVVRITGVDEKQVPRSVEFYGMQNESLGTTDAIEYGHHEIIVRPSVELTRIRMGVIGCGGGRKLRVLIQHPSLLAAGSRSSKQGQIRAALGALGSNSEDISKVIATVEKVIFSDNATREVEQAVRERKSNRSNGYEEPAPTTLAVSVVDTKKAKRKVQFLKSGDLAYLLDILLRRLSEGLETNTLDTDRAGRTEEEQIGTDDDEAPERGVRITRKDWLNDVEVAKVVSRRARALTRRMVDQLKLASKDSARRAGASLQLVAVLALVRELRFLDQSPRWRKTGQLLVEKVDRTYLYDESLRYLLGSDFRLIDHIDQLSGEPSEESLQLVVLMLWLAWDLGEELAASIGPIWDVEGIRNRLHANAVFLQLMPRLVNDDAGTKLEECMLRTARRTPEAMERVKQWLANHLEFGELWRVKPKCEGELKLGAYCCVQNNAKVAGPQVVVELTESYVGFWDFGKVRKFKRDFVIPVVPATQ